MNLVKISSHLVGLGYELGKMDCFSLIVEYMKMRGCKIPETFEELTLETYADLFIIDPAKAKEIMIRFMQSQTDELSIGECFAGDIALLSCDDTIFLSIVGGNGTCIGATTEYGVRVLPMNIYKIKRVFRCHL